jgi:hypothetical protein
MALSPILDVPVRWQVSGVDVESIQPHRGFPADGFDVANVNGTLLVENTEQRKVRLVVPFPVEQGSAEVRVVSTGKRTAFRARDGRAEQFVDFLRAIGEIPADQEPVLKEVRQAVRDYVVADIDLPPGQQLLRFHARQLLRPVGEDPRAFEVELFAPLAGFILSPSGQSSMSVTVAFPPAFAAPGLAIGTPTITPLPGQAAPPEQPSAPVTMAERQIYGWLWRNDPKLTIPYRYQ